MLWVLSPRAPATVVRQTVVNLFPSWDEDPHRYWRDCSREPWGRGYGLHCFRKIAGHRTKSISWTAERKPNRDWTDDVAPIKICRSALAPNVPHRDLYLSPGHALYLDGVLEWLLRLSCE